MVTWRTAVRGRVMSTQLRLLASVAAHLVKSMHGIMAVYATCIASLHSEAFRLPT